MAARDIPRLFIAAAQSGAGKTTVTCGILAALKKRGLRVQAYKAGPDYIDPGYLTLASGRPAHNLDTWLVDESTAARLFAQTARGADVCVAEGVMGLYDGGRGGVSSTAELSKLFRSPVVLVIDAKSAGPSAAAVALGFREYDRGVDLRGVILNRVASDSHRDMVAEAMARVGIPVLGALMRDGRFTVPERHLGLLPAQENPCGFDGLAEVIERSADLGELLRIARSAPPLDVPEPAPPPVPDVRAVIAAARDEAFSFYYPESLAELERAGARIVPFSPLNDAELPECDGLILGGGFPEMFAASLAEGGTMRASVALAAARGMPIYAECGGFMYLTRELTDFEGRTYPMAGVVPAGCRMNARLQAVGYVTAELLRDTVLGRARTAVRAHEFHFSSAESCAGCEAWRAVKARTGAVSLAGYASGNVLASYLHIHFAGNPALARNFTSACAKFRESRRACPTEP